MCERLFSYGKKVVGILRARMTPELLESIVPNGKQTFMGPEDVGRDAKAVPNNEEDEIPSVILAADDDLSEFGEEFQVLDV